VLFRSTELHITPQMLEYAKIAHDVFLLLLDGKLRSRTETLKYLKPLAPPPPPPPPPPPAKRGRAAKAAAAAAAQAQAAATAVAPAPGKKKGKAGAPISTPVVAAPALNAKGKPGASAKQAPVPAKPATSTVPARSAPRPVSAKNHKPVKVAAKKPAAKKKH